MYQSHLEVTTSVSGFVCAAVWAGGEAWLSQELHNADPEDQAGEVRRQEQRRGHQQGQGHCQWCRGKNSVITGVGMCTREQRNNGSTSAHTDQGETRYNIF